MVRVATNETARENSSEPNAQKFSATRSISNKKKPAMTTKNPIAKTLIVAITPLRIISLSDFLATFRAEFYVVGKRTAARSAFFNQRITAIRTEFLVFFNNFAAF